MEMTMMIMMTVDDFNLNEDYDYAEVMMINFKF